MREITIRKAEDLDPKDPEPGIYRGVPFDVYQHTAAVNHGIWHRFRETESWAAALSVEDDTSLSQRTGSLFHMAVLEPERFRATVVFGGPINPRTGSEYGRGTKAWEEAAREAEEAGKVLVAESEREKFHRMVESLRANRIALRTVMQPEAAREATIVWEQEFKRTDGKTFSIRCKARPDILPLAPKEKPFRWVDIKTTERPLSAKSLMRMFDAYGYADSGAWYRMGLKALTGMDWSPLFVVVQTRPPYEVVVAEVPDDWLTASQGWMSCHLADLEACLRTGRWLRAGEAWNADYTVPLSGVVMVDAPRWRVADFVDGM